MRNKAGKEFSDPYKSNLPKYIHVIKVYLQFIIGLLLICVLGFKGLCEILETTHLLDYFPETAVVTHILGVDTFSYIANTLAISAGIELGYMLFTNGPDEAIEPLMLGVTSAAFYTLSANFGGSWVLGIYALSILVLMYCLKKYKDWGLDHEDEEPEKISTSASYSVSVKTESEGSFSVDVEDTTNRVAGGL
ncbi:hypothetical protein [Pseudoalteromonas sp. ZZD1]|uniref:hypothetical protein n=1 Tax=Pseudoalteromonas sp. ZZD1 TaxID=3139395 RepID=UPI003BAD8D6D